MYVRQTKRVGHKRYNTTTLSSLNVERVIVSNISAYFSDLHFSVRRLVGVDKESLSLLVVVENRNGQK